MRRGLRRFVWFELLTHEVDAARSFYGQLFAWKIETTELANGMAYPVIKVGDAPVGGIMRPPADNAHSAWLSYISVDDVDHTAKKVVEAGGKAVGPPFDVPGYGRIQTVQDPHGGVFGLWRGETSDLTAPHGPGSFHWNELWTTDPSAEVRFYCDALGYTAATNPTAHGDYHILKDGPEWCAGMMGLPVPGLPPMWMKYVAVDNVSIALERAAAAGGQVLAPPAEMPGTGVFCVIQDPVGAAIGMIQPEGGTR